jgi:hypothetical protein
MLSDNQKQQILAMYAAGEKIEVIALLVGCRSDEVSTAANKNGIRRTSRCKFMKSRDEAIAADYLSGLKMLTISERHGLEVSNIYRALKREGVTERRCKRISEKQKRYRKAAQDVSVDELVLI